MKRLYDDHEGQTTRYGDELILQDKPEFQSKITFVSDFEVWSELRQAENTLQQHQLQNDSSPSQMDSKKKLRPNWKEGLEFLQEYGYDLETLSPYTRISIQTDKSLTTLGGRSAPTAEKLLSYLEKHPTYRVAYRYKEEELHNSGYWCKYCGIVTENLAHHQLNCLYKSESINTATYPSNMYSLLDTTVNFEIEDENGYVDEWISLFGPFADLSIGSILGEGEGRDEDPIPDIPVPPEHIELANKPIPCSEDAWNAIHTALNCVIESIMEDCNEESMLRTNNQVPERRVLVPPLLHAVNKKNTFVQFVSNTGLQKPDAFE